MRVDSRASLNRVFLHWQGGPIRIREGDGDNPTVEPRWLKPLLATSFFSSCQIHGMYSHKCECNLFCLECTERGGICSLCLPQHKDHHVVQVRTLKNHLQLLLLQQMPPNSRSARNHAWENKIDFVLMWMSSKSSNFVAVYLWSCACRFDVRPTTMWSEFPRSRRCWTSQACRLTSSTARA